MSLDDILPSNPADRARKFFFSEDFGRRLELERTLRGHRLCVNRITWNAEGTMLISGSDDRRVCLHPHRREGALPLSVVTQHASNIFGVQSLPFSNDRLLVSGAMDTTVQLHELERTPTAHFSPATYGDDANTYVENASDEDGDDVQCVNVTPTTTTFMCHRGRVKDVKVDPTNAHLFWSVSEDGNVRQCDKRCSFDSQARTDSRNVLIGVPWEGHQRPIPLKGLDINKAFPHQMAVACGDPFVRIYDRRKLGLGFMQTTFPEPIISLSPPHLAMAVVDDDERHQTTYVNFSRRGDKVVTSYHGDHAYSFDITSAGSTAAIYIKPPTTHLHHQANGSSETWLQSTPEATRKAREAEKEFRWTNVTSAIQLFSEAIACAPTCPLYYLERARCYLKRELAGDVMEALRDADQAIVLKYDQPNAHVIRLRCLEKLGQRRTARTVLSSFLDKFPLMRDNKEVVEIQQRLSPKATSNGKRPTNSKRTREEEGSEADEGDVSMEDAHASGLDAERRAGAPESTVEETEDIGNGREESLYQHYCKKPPRHSNIPEGVWWNTVAGKRTLTRYIGQRNVQTDIKECVFLGENDKLVACGSDDGSVFIYDAETGRPVNVLKADQDVANCVQCHPFESCLATSGIESVIRVWSPTGDRLNKAQLDQQLAGCIESLKRDVRDEYLSYGTMLASIRMYFPDRRRRGDELHGDNEEEDDEDSAEDADGSTPCNFV